MESHTDNEIVRRMNASRPSYTAGDSQKIGPYGGPPIGALIRFNDQRVSAKELKAMAAKGVGYPWGLTGRIDSISVHRNRYRVIIHGCDDQVYMVDNFLAIELLELPGEFD